MAVKNTQDYQKQMGEQLENVQKQMRQVNDQIKALKAQRKQLRQVETATIGALQLLELQARDAQTEPLKADGV